jgi:dolichol-phosphate mannosyltransferase
MRENESNVVVIPTYNEVDGITTVLDAVLEAMPGLTVLVVDDTSPDGTATRVREHPQYGVRVQLLQRAVKDGLGGAYRSGFRWALDGGFDNIGQMDADMSHPPARLPALFSALAEGDVVIGSRYVRGGHIQNWSWIRRLISWGGNVYVRLVLGLPVRDATAGFKVFRREALTFIGATESESNGYCFQIENTWRASRSGLKLVEVPITFTDRTVGESKMTRDIVLEAMLRVLGWRWQELVARPRARVSDDAEVSA